MVEIVISTSGKHHGGGGSDSDISSKRHRRHEEEPLTRGKSELPNGKRREPQVRVDLTAEPRSRIDNSSLSSAAGKRITSRQEEKGDKGKSSEPVDLTESAPSTNTGINDDDGPGKRTTKKQAIVLDSDGDGDDDDDGSDGSDDIEGEGILDLFIEKSRREEDDDDQEDDNNTTRRSRRISERTASNNAFSFADEPAAPKYRFSLDSLVTRAVDDREVEDNVAELKASFEAAAATAAKAHELGLGDIGIPQKQMLTAVFETDNDDSELHRLYEAVQRTEAFDQGRQWSFFDTSVPLQSAVEEFPQVATVPGSYASKLIGE